MTNGYDFYFKDDSDVLAFPITPSELSIKVGSKNKVVTLINEGDINILKSPALIDVEFEARFPMRKYPYSREVSDFQNYFDKFKELKENKKSFRFIVARTTLKDKRSWDTNILVSLEDFELKENADEGDDVIVAFKLRQYKHYGVKKLDISQYGVSKTTYSVSNQSRSGNNGSSSTKTYTVKSGDCLWNIAKSMYNDGSLWTKIYNANKTAINEDARKHGKADSSNGHWIYPGLTLTIPAK